MAENKTKATDASVTEYIAAMENAERRSDCEALIKLMSKVTGNPPVMWGPGIIGFDSYHYKYESGREGDWCVTGFSPRKNDISVHLLGCGANPETLLAKLGKHKMAKSCLYVRKLSDIDLKVLEQLIRESVADFKQRFG